MTPRADTHGMPEPRPVLIVDDHEPGRLERLRAGLAAAEADAALRAWCAAPAAG